MTDLPKVEPCDGYCKDPCCWDRDQERSGRCWGKIRPVEEVQDDDGHGWIHACEGHADMYETGKYLEYVAPLVLEPKTLKTNTVVSAHAQSVMDRGRPPIWIGHRADDPHWTKDPPEKSGWYWTRQQGRTELVEIRGARRTDQRIYGESFHGLEVDEIEEEWDLMFWSVRIEEPPI